MGQGQYETDQVWFQENQREIEEAAAILVDFLEGRGDHPRGVLQRAKLLLDRANTIEWECPVGAPSPGSGAGLGTYRRRRPGRRSIRVRPTKAGNGISQLGKAIEKWRREANKLRVAVGNAAQPLQRGELEEVSYEMYRARDALSEAAVALDRAGAELDRVRQKRGRSG